MEMAKPSEVRKNRDWQHLIETFSKQFIDFDFTLQQIQTVFGSINNLVTNRF
jgi:hypothetical protein